MHHSDAPSSVVCSAPQLPLSSLSRRCSPFYTDGILLRPNHRSQNQATNLLTRNQDVYDWRPTMTNENQSEALIPERVPAAPPQPKPSSRWLWIGLAAAAIVGGTVIYSGIHERAQAETAL